MARQQQWRSISDAPPARLPNATHLGPCCLCQHRQPVAGLALGAGLGAARVLALGRPVGRQLLGLGVAALRLLVADEVVSAVRLLLAAAHVLCLVVVAHGAALGSLVALPGEWGGSKTVG